MIWIARLLRGVWWVSVVWLALLAVFIFYCFAQWLIHWNDPQRYETAIASGIALLYSFPAGLWCARRRNGSENESIAHQAHRRHRPGTVLHRLRLGVRLSAGKISMSF